MEILGLVFVGTSSAPHVEMGEFCRDVLGVTPVEDAGVRGALFELTDASRVARSQA